MLRTAHTKPPVTTWPHWLPLRQSQWSSGQDDANDRSALLRLAAAALLTLAALGMAGSLLAVH